MNKATGIIPLEHCTTTGELVPILIIEVKSDTMRA
jgi:hypothetical protein